MTQTYTSSATSILLAAAIVAMTWLHTVSTPSAAKHVAAAPAAAPTHVILA